MLTGLSKIPPEVKPYILKKHKLLGKNKPHVLYLDPQMYPSIEPTFHTDLRARVEKLYSHSWGQTTPEPSSMQAKQETLKK